MSESGELARYRIVHFATHCAMAGELSLSGEAGLIPTPPTHCERRRHVYL
jgi:hypothetical protein